MQKAIRYFEEAVKTDPGYAPAYAGLAACYSILPSFGPIPPKETFAKAREMALTALQIDETLSQAHSILGSLEATYGWNWEGAEKLFKRAIKLNPSDASTYHRYSLSLLFRARFGESSKAVERAFELDPISFPINVALGAVYFFSHRFDRAVRISKKVIKMDPLRVYAHLNLGMAYLGKSMYEEALVEFQKEEEISQGSHAWTDVFTGITYVRTGREDEAQKVLYHLLERSKREYISPFLMASLNFVLGQKDEGFKLLDSAYAQHDQWLCWLKINPALESVRSDLRYTALLRKMNLEE